ncbi:MAG TPA: FtsH protease activity modulator HflK [Syntrophobacter fumaroxidans]|nr:FtsH protease activity modulator HflK [Syntrophobacter fumaroxidans]
MMVWQNPPGRTPGHDSLKDFEEILARLKNRYKLPPITGGPVFLIVLVAAVILIGYNSFYIVQPQETAVIQRFGAYSHTAEAGLHAKLPFGIDTVRKVPTGRVLQHEYGYRSVKPGVRSTFKEKEFEEEAVMLSGDLNVVNLQWMVQYKIQNPVDFLFRVHDVEGTLDDISESVVRRIVGNRYSDDVLTVGRASIADMAKVEIQAILDTYQTGIKIVTVQLQNANPPDMVKAAFNEVNEAQQERERMINEAQQAYNQKIPKTMGEARQTISQAEGYALERVNRSQGEVQRFQNILSEYEKAPDVTRRRMYLDAMGELMGRVEHLYVIDENQRNLLPLFDLNRGNKGDAKSGK